MYEEQNSLNDQAVAVNSKICELLTSFPCNQTNDQNGNTVEYLDFSSELMNILMNPIPNYSIVMRLKLVLKGRQQKRKYLLIRP